MKTTQQISPGMVIGVFATIVFTIAVHTIPLLGFTKIDLSKEIAKRLFGEAQRLYLIGHALHYCTGTLLAVAYHLFGRNWIAVRIKNPSYQLGLVYGTVWSLLAYLASLVFLILIGQSHLIVTTGIFSLLIAHLLYGVIIGAFLEYDKG
ncbi:MAG: hypothetical protein ACE5HO_02745 [bacterium]